jgi:hypothetical protein
MTKYSEVLFRHRIRFAALLLIPLVAAGALAYELASFRATATMSVADPASFGATFVPAGWSQNLSPAQNVADSSALIVKTESFAQGLSDALSSADPSLTPSQTQKAVTSLQSNLRISTAGSHLVVFGYSCHDGPFCVEVLGSAISTIRQQLIDSERNLAAQTTAFWTAQLKDAKSNLGAAQAALQSYAQANPGVSVDAGSSDPQVVLLRDTIAQWRARVAQAQDSLSLAQYSSTSSARLIDMGTALVGSPQLTSPPVIGDLSSLKPAAAALIAGLLIILAYLVLLGRADQTVRDPKSIERRLGVPVVATIPKLAGSRGV